jgi:hypothetical protein
MVVVLGLKPWACQFNRIPVGAFLNVAICSDVGIVVSGVVTNIEVVNSLETHVGR